MKNSWTPRFGENADLAVKNVKLKRGGGGGNIMKNSWSPRFGENNFLFSNNISVTEIAKAIIEAAMIHYVTKNPILTKEIRKLKI